MATQKTATASTITEIMTKVVKLLAPLGSEDRQKVVQASLTLLGESPGAYKASRERKALDGNGVGGTEPPQGMSKLPAKANTWLRQNAITAAQLEDVFDIDGQTVTVIASNMPGKNTKAKTLNAYVIHGVSRLLATGESNFDDKSARQLCENSGCYDSSNHAIYLGAIGNTMTGSKEKGWKLTGPGLRKGAELVKEMTKGA